MAQRKSNHKRRGGLDFPTLLTAREFSAIVLEGRRSVEWVRAACKRRQILACQLVGGDWVIAQDTLIRPRHLVGMPNALLDMDLPLDILVPGNPVEVDVPEYKPRPKDIHKLGTSRKVKVPGLRRIRLAKGLSTYDVERLTGVTRTTQRTAEQGMYKTPETVLKLAAGLDIDVEDLLRYD